MRRDRAGPRCVAAAAGQPGAEPEPQWARATTELLVPDSYLRAAPGRLVPVALVRDEQDLEQLSRGLASVHARRGWAGQVQQAAIQATRVHRPQLGR